jgi:hypothetical protein
MSRPPKLDLAAIVAAATPPARKTADIVQLDMPAPRPKPAATLKERARQMSVYLEPPVYDQLRDLAHTERTKMHALMLEALDLLFKQRGARSIEQINEAEGR